MKEILLLSIYLIKEKFMKYKNTTKREKVIKFLVQNIGGIFLLVSACAPRANAKTQQTFAIVKQQTQTILEENSESNDFADFERLKINITDYRRQKTNKKVPNRINVVDNRKVIVEFIVEPEPIQQSYLPDLSPYGLQKNALKEGIKIPERTRIKPLLNQNYGIENVRGGASNQGLLGLTRLVTILLFLQIQKNQIPNKPVEPVVPRPRPNHKKFFESIQGCWHFMFQNPEYLLPFLVMIFYYTGLIDALYDYIFDAGITKADLETNPWLKKTREN